MSIYQNLEDSIFNIVYGLHPDWTIVMAYDNGPEPLTPYMVIDVQRIINIGREYTSTPTIGPDGLPLDQTTLQDQEARVRLEFIGKSGAAQEVSEMAETLLVELRSPRGYELMAENKLSLFAVPSVRRLPLKRETDMYMLYQLDCRFAFTAMLEFQVDYAKGFNADGTYTDAGREPDHEIHTRIEMTFP